MCYKTPNSDSALVETTSQEDLEEKESIFLVIVTVNRCGNETRSRCRFNLQVTFHARTLIPRPELALINGKAITGIKFSIWIICRG